MKNEKLSCLAVTVVFVALAVASGAFVALRAMSMAAAIFGGIVGGILLLIVLGWLTAIPRRTHEWWLTLRARLGSTPADGRRAAIIGTLRSHGELLTPFSRQRCALYEYEVVATKRSGRSTTMTKPYQGFAMAPLYLEHNGERTRILARPVLPKPEVNWPDSAAASRAAKEFIESTSFTPPPEVEREPDLSLTDGTLRYDYLRGDPPNLLACAYVERFLTPDSGICAIGRFDAGRNALLGPVTLRRGTSFVIDAAWRVVNAAVASLIFAAITFAVAMLFLVNVPLDAAEQARPARMLRWWEVEMERAVERYARIPLAEAGMLQSRGYYLQDVCVGCARGRLEVNGRVIELAHATYAGGKAVHLSAGKGSRDGVTLTGQDHVVLTIDGRSAQVPPGWLQPGDIETSLGSEGDYAGRVTIMAPDGSIRCRVYFKTQVDENAWLSSRASGSR